jgi:hypothetical protein
MLEALTQAGKTLEIISRRRPDQPPYVLLRLSGVHPTAHISANDGRWTVCGIYRHLSFSVGVEGATRLCSKCSYWAEKQLR